MKQFKRFILLVLCIGCFSSTLLVSAGSNSRTIYNSQKTVKAYSKASYSKATIKDHLKISAEINGGCDASKIGASNSAYYKYKDKIFEYNEQGDDVTAINAKLIDNAGVLSSVMNELYLAGANILAVNQSIPVNNIADVSITVRLSQTDVSTEDLISKIKNIGGVKSAEIV